MTTSKNNSAVPARNPHHNGRFPLRRFLFAGIASIALLNTGMALALDYPYAPYNEGKMDPQLTGWPLTQAEIDYLKIATYKRRPGSEVGKQRMDLLPCTPAADGSGTPNWYVLLQEKFVKVVDKFKAEHGNNLDILLVGDSITWQWIDISAPYSQYPQKFNNAWKENFSQYSVFNLGVAGDKTQGVLWRLDHGATQGSSGEALNPRVVILAIGHNNMYFTPETGIQGAANGILWCVKNLRAKFPDADIIVSKILPNTRPEAQFYKDAKAINAALDPLLAAQNDSKVHVLPDMWNDMTNPDGTLIENLYRTEEPAGKKIHLHPVTGYKLWASKLKPLVEKLLRNKSTAQH